MLLAAREAAKARAVWYTLSLALDEATHERELEMIGHDIWWTRYLPLLEEQLEMGHRLVLELLEPFMKLHMVLIRTRIVVLSAAGLAPVGLCLLEGALNLVVEHAVPNGSCWVELDGKHAGLDA